MSNLTITVKEKQEVATAAVERVKFYGEEIEATRSDGAVWVSLRRCCESLGVDYASQYTKLKKKRWCRIVLNAIPDARGRSQDTVMIHVDSLPMWLATIEPSRVLPQLRDWLVKWQVEAAAVLRDHFYGDFARRPNTPLPRWMRVEDYCEKWGLGRDREDRCHDWFALRELAARRCIPVERVMPTQYPATRFPIELLEEYYFDEIWPRV